MNKQVQPFTPAALHARVSSDRQDVDISVAAQLRALRDYAKNNGYSVAREYVDEAESSRIADRRQFRAMIDEGGEATAPFQVILVWKFSRFTRQREHAVALRSMLRRKGVGVVSITGHAGDSPTGKLWHGRTGGEGERHRRRGDVQGRHGHADLHGDGDPSRRRRRLACPPSARCRKERKSPSR